MNSTLQATRPALETLPNGRANGATAEAIPFEIMIDRIENTPDEMDENTAQFVRLPTVEFLRMLEIIEQYGMYLAMKEVKPGPRMNREEALLYLESDED